MAPYNEKRAENNLKKKKKRIYQFKANFISVLQLLINK